MITAAVAVPFGAPVPSLTRWGLSSDADLVFRTLRTFGAQPARALSTELGLSRQRTDAALAELHACGAATPTASDARAALWVGMPADEVVQRLRTRQMRRPHAQSVARLHREIFETLNARLSSAGLPLRPVLAGTIGSGVRYLNSRPLMRRRLAELMLAEQHEHLVINNEETPTAEADRAAPFDVSMFHRGVRFRVLGRPPMDGDAAVGPEDRLDVPTFRYRETLDTPLKLFVCDRRTALVPVDGDDLERGYFEIVQPEVISALLEIFEARWTAGVDPRRGGVPAISLSDRERLLIGLLADGHTDVTAARELRISARSVTNTLRALMDRLGVENRFQLGLALGAMDVAAPPALAGEQN